MKSSFANYFAFARALGSVLRAALFSFLVTLPGFQAQAGPIVFDANQASGTERLSALTQVEFLLDDGAGRVAAKSSTLTFCGRWIFKDGKKEKFFKTWQLDGSNVMENGKAIGSYYDGNFMIESHAGNGDFESIEVSRYQEKFFEFHYHHPKTGFADGDGWIVKKASDGLTEACSASNSQIEFTNK